MLRPEPPELERCLRPLDAASEERVKESHQLVGARISACGQKALLLDVLLPDCPVVGVSRGFEAWSGKSCTALLGRTWRVLLEGVSEGRISRSSCQDVENFLRMARLSRLCAMADCSVSLTACRGDGELVSCRGCFQLVKERPDSEHFALCWLQEQSEEEEPSKLLEALRCSETRWPTPVMFPAPLSNKCCLTNMMSSALRREPQQVPRGCVALSRLALPERDGSYFFSVRVDRVLPSWTSRLPFLGVTCVSPEEVHRSRCFFGSLPHAFCLAESAVAGGTGEAWLHAESWPLVPKLGQQLEAEATRRHLSSLPEHRRAAPFVPRCGDLLGCRYRNLREAEKGPELASAIGLYVNGDLAFEFDFPRRLPSKPLYAVVDVCHCVYQVTMQPSAEDLLMGS